MVHFDLALAPIDANRTYRWSFQGSEYSLQAVVPPRAYVEYAEMDVPRSYFFGYTDADVQRFVTSDDPIVVAIASQLRNMQGRRRRRLWPAAGSMTPGCPPACGWSSAA